MKSYTEKLHAELLAKLDELNRNYDPLNLMDCRLQFIADAIDQIKEKLKKYSFKKPEEEIHYFKKILPNTLSLYFYYKDKMEWDRIVRLGTDKTRFNFHDRIFLQAENFRSENLFFYHYCQSGKTDGDDVYFIKTTTINKEQNYQPRLIIDPSTPPLYCELLARYIAYTRLEFDSKNIIAGNDESLHPVKSTVKRLKWTGKNVELNELGNALFETGSFNYGKATKKEIFDYLELVFDVKVGDPYRIFQDVVRRKGSSTVFLDLLKEKLMYRIDEMLN
jgi:hypothetical protein